MHGLEWTLDIATTIADNCHTLEGRDRRATFAVSDVVCAGLVFDIGTGRQRRTAGADIDARLIGFVADLFVVPAFETGSALQLAIIEAVLRLATVRCARHVVRADIRRGDANAEGPLV